RAVPMHSFGDRARKHRGGPPRPAVPPSRVAGMLASKTRSVETRLASSREVSRPRRQRPAPLRLEALEDRLTPSGFDPITEDPANTPGTLVRSLLAGSHAAGLAVTDADQSNGTWQFATDGKTWADFGSVSPGEARLLLADSRIRFVPDANFF